MTAKPTPSVRYEAPAIEERTPINVPLVALNSLPSSAEFRPTVAYEPPAIKERTPLGMPLAGMPSGGSAVFRPAPRD